MLDLLFVPTALLYFVVIGLLFVYGVNFFYLAFLAWRHRHAQTPTSSLQTLPRVTVQLPIYNELYVARRLIDAAAQLDYPRDLLDVQVLDDSTDETTTLAPEAVERWQAQGVYIVQLHRTQRDGFKAGALAHGLAHARGEFIAIFDADFIPPRDYLTRTPKFGIAAKHDDWRTRRYQLRLDPIVFVEFAFALLNAGTVALALHVGNWIIAAYAALFCIGLLFTSGLTVAQAVAMSAVNQRA